MANTDYLESTPAVFSSVSLNGSGGTLSALTVVASNLSVSGLVFSAQAITINPSNKTNPALNVLAPSQFTIGNALAPALGFLSEASLGFYRSAASRVALSYGGLIANMFVSGLTASTSGTTANTTDGAIRFSILSLTSNGAQMAVRSGNSTWLFASDAVA